MKHETFPINLSKEEQRLMLEMASHNIQDCEFCNTPTPKQLLKKAKFDEGETFLICEDCYLNIDHFKEEQIKLLEMEE